MTDMVVYREYRAEDIPALSALWKECFGDSDGFIRKFFAALPSIGGGAVAEILQARHTPSRRRSLSRPAAARGALDTYTAWACTSAFAVSAPASA